MNEQFERIYKKTKNFGRTQFVREIQMQINSNKKLEKENEQLRLILGNQLRIKDELSKKIDKAIEVIESYNLGKYDYSIPPGGIIELLEILKDSDVDD